MSRRATTADAFDIVRTAARALPDVEETTKAGAPAWQLGGAFMARVATHPSAEPDTLIVRSGYEERGYLLEEAPETYYVTDYYEPHPVVLVRLSRIAPDALRDVLKVSWQLTLPKARLRRR